MARLPRVVVVDVPQHVTHRGNARQAILSTDAHRITYLELPREYAARTTAQLHFSTMKISEIGVRPVCPQILEFRADSRNGAGA